MLSEIYNYIDALPKQVQDIFKVKEYVCSVEYFGYRWYFDVSIPEKEPEKYKNWFDYLVTAIVKVESKNQQIENKKLIEHILKKSQSFVSSYLYTIVAKLRAGYLYHQVQFVPFMFKQIEDDETRLHWKVFSLLGFKSIKDSNYQEIMSNPVLLKWIIHNITKDQQDEVEKLKALQMFINPEMYREVYKQTRLTKDLLSKVNTIYGQLKAKGGIGAKKK